MHDAPHAPRNSERGSGLRSTRYHQEKEQHFVHPTSHASNSPQPHISGAVDGERWTGLAGRPRSTRADSHGAGAIGEWSTRAIATSKKGAGTDTANFGGAAQAGTVASTEVRSRRKLGSHNIAAVHAEKNVPDGHRMSHYGPDESGAAMRGPRTPGRRTGHQLTVYNSTRRAV